MSAFGHFILSQPVLCLSFPVTVGGEPLSAKCEKKVRYQVVAMPIYGLLITILLYRQQ